MNNSARLPLAVIAVLALGWSITASASTTTSYFYNGIVDKCPITGFPPCGTILFEDDAISGPIVVDSGAIEPNGSFSYTDVLSFSFMVGQFFVVDSTNSNLIAGAIGLDPNGDIDSGMLVILAEAIDAPPTQITVDVDSHRWFAEILLPDQGPITISSGTGKFGPAVIPLPAGLALFAPALCALALIRRRR